MPLLNLLQFALISMQFAFQLVLFNSAAAWMTLVSCTGPGRERCYLALQSARPGAKWHLWRNDLGAAVWAHLLAGAKVSRARPVDAPLCKAISRRSCGDI